MSLYIKDNIDKFEHIFSSSSVHSDFVSVHALMRLKIKKQNQENREACNSCNNINLKARKKFDIFLPRLSGESGASILLKCVAKMLPFREQPKSRTNKRTLKLYIVKITRKNKMHLRVVKANSLHTNALSNSKQLI
jgi:LAS superfamily LD-carboxypeptidase LdcB